MHPVGGGMTRPKEEKHVAVVAAGVLHKEEEDFQNGFGTSAMEVSKYAEGGGTPLRRGGAQTPLGHR